MTNIKRIGLVMALAWVVTLMVLHNIGNPNALLISGAVGILFLLIAILIAVRANHFDQTSIFLDDVKAGMKQAAVFAIVVSGFTYGFFRFIAPEILEERIDLRVEAERDRIENLGWEEFKKKANDPSLDEKSQEDYLDDARASAEQYLSPGFIMMMSLLGLVSISFIYSLLLTIAYRRVLVKYERR